MRNNIMVGFVVAALLIINFSIYKKENLLKNGEEIYIQIIPRDPRSLMQGDYHVLRYRVPTVISNEETKLPRKGYLVLTLGENKVAAITRVFKSSGKLTSKERLIQYRVRSRGIRIGAESFFFQEGHGHYYNGARYAELRLASNGHSLLVALRDAQLKKIAPPKIPGNQD